MCSQDKQSSSIKEEETLSRNPHTCKVTVQSAAKLHNNVHQTGLKSIAVICGASVRARADKHTLAAV